MKPLTYYYMVQIKDTTIMSSWIDYTRLYGTKEIAKSAMKECKRRNPKDKFRIVKILYENN